MPFIKPNILYTLIRFNFTVTLYTLSVTLLFLTEIHTLFLIIHAVQFTLDLILPLPLLG